MRQITLENRLHNLPKPTKSQLERQLSSALFNLLELFRDELQWGLRLLEALFTLGGHKSLQDTLNHCTLSSPPLVEIGVNASAAAIDSKSFKKNFPRAMQYWLEELDRAISEMFKSNDNSNWETILQHEDTGIVLDEKSGHPLFIIAGEAGWVYPKNIHDKSETWGAGMQKDLQVQNLVWQNDWFSSRLHIVEGQWNNPGYWNAGAMRADHYCPAIQITAAPQQVQEMKALAGPWLSTQAIVYFVVHNSQELKTTPPEPYELQLFYKELNSLVLKLYGANAQDPDFDKRYYSLTDEQINQLHQRTEKMHYTLQHLDGRYAFYVPHLMHNTCLRLCAVLTDLRLLSGCSTIGYEIKVGEVDFRTAILLTDTFFAHMQLLLSFFPEYGGE